MHVLRAHPPSCHCKALSQVNVEQRKLSVGQSCDWLLQVKGRAIGRRGSVLVVAQRSSQRGSDKLNQYGHGVENQWPWPGRSLNMVKPTPIHGQLLLLV